MGMITSSMKRKLINHMGYTVNKIKKMTPQQASLISHYSIVPSLYDEKIPNLQQKYTANKQEEQERQQIRDGSSDNDENRYKHNMVFDKAKSETDECVNVTNDSETTTKYDKVKIP